MLALADKIKKTQNTGLGRLGLGARVAFAALSNGYAAGFIQGKIYTGPTKQLCLPGLNCYSCPGALGSCPIGALQSVLASRDFGFSFYAVGFLMMVGAIFGRVVCGWLCPFGLIQDLLRKIPFPKKLKRLPGERWLRWLKYAVLLGFVILLPLTVLDAIGQGQPWFCKLICPSGTLMAGLPLTLANEPLRGALGGLFTWKLLALIALLLLSIVVWRPFCRYLCPLGAVYGLFNPIAFCRLEVDKSACISCGACQKACAMDIPVWQKPNSPECVRCGACQRACPENAICSTLSSKRKEALNNGHVQ